ncbi:MAG: phosphopentomutase [Lachnospiraceae bacterium]
MRRVFLIVLDSFGIGEMEDAAAYGDTGTNTIRSASTSSFFHMPNMRKLGLFNIDGVTCGQQEESPTACVARMKEASKGKDTTIGHWEIAGVYSGKPLPTFPNGFPQDFLDRFCEMTGRGILCNQPYSGTEVIQAYGEEHVRTGKLIVYTSADSVFQIAAHEDIVPLEELYQYCAKAREMLTGDLGVGRVIARPFIGTNGQYTRTSHRHDYSLLPPDITMLDQISNQHMDVIGVGKIHDIFAGKGITEYTYTTSNADGIAKTLDLMDRDFHGLCFVNLVDYDMLYGHRNDIDGYAKALSYFDEMLPQLMGKLREEDVLMMTADHGCDPGYTVSTDHSREHVPFLMYGSQVTPANLGTRETFSDIGATVLDYLGIEPQIKGISMRKTR